MTGISDRTLRYYDRQGIMPFLKKDAHGNRVFDTADLQWLQVVDCMKVSGFTLAEMREYADLVRRGDETLAERLAIFKEHRRKTLQMIDELRASLDSLNYKCWYYEKALEAGTEQIHFIEDGYDQALCYQRFKDWERNVLKHPSRARSAFAMRADPSAPRTPRV